MTFKRALRTRGIPKGWRIATSAEFLANKQEILSDAMKDNWCILALADGTAEGRGYGGGKARKGVRADDVPELLLTNVDVSEEYEEDFASPEGSPARGRQGGRAAGGGLSPGRSLNTSFDNRGRSKSPSAKGGWNRYHASTSEYSHRDSSKPRVIDAASRVTSPNRQEATRRKQWREEQRSRAESRAREISEKMMMEDYQRMEFEQQRLEARRVAIRERISKHMEDAARQAEERKAAEKQAKEKTLPFLAAGRLYQKKIEEFDKQKNEEEKERKHHYDEYVRKYKMARVNAIVSGQVIVRPPPPLAPPVKQRQTLPSIPRRGAFWSDPGVRDNPPLPPTATRGGGGLEARTGAPLLPQV